MLFNGKVGTVWLYFVGVQETFDGVGQERRVTNDHYACSRPACGVTDQWIAPFSKKLIDAS
jgi:hypothetical protein